MLIFSIKLRSSVASVASTLPCSNKLCNQPVLFLERHYGAPTLEKTILELAKTKAKEMKLTLTSTNTIGGADNGKPLQSLGGLAPFEYCDAAGQVTKNGVFTVTEAQIIPL